MYLFLFLHQNVFPFLFHDVFPALHQGIFSFLFQVVFLFLDHIIFTFLFHSVFSFRSSFSFHNHSGLLQNQQMYALKCRIRRTVFFSAAKRSNKRSNIMKFSIDPYDLRIIDSALGSPLKQKQPSYKRINVRKQSTSTSTRPIINGGIVDGVIDGIKNWILHLKRVGQQSFVRFDAI